MLKKIFTITLSVVTLFFSSIAFAWDFTGHVLIAEIAYNNLTPTAKQKADRLAQDIFVHLPEDQQQKLNDHYPTANTFAKIALLPDVWRKWHVATVFNDFNAPLPADLVPYANDNTQSWHFINYPYPNTQCQIIKPQNVVWAVNTVEQGFKETNNVNTDAALMVFLEHYVGDANQPMHAITHVNAACEGDRGGNDYCIRLSSSGRCTKSLHALWDSGVGYLKPHLHIAQAAYELQQAYPKAQFTSAIDLTPLDWTKTADRYAAFAYSTPENQKPSPAYYNEGQSIAKQQLALAGYRLARVLNTLFSE